MPLANSNPGKIRQNLDSDQIEIANKIYIFHLSKSINKYVHLLK